MSARKLLGVALAASTLGCAIGPNYERPELPTTPAFRDQAEATASIADLPWWEVFGDETLAALIRESLENNRDLAVAAANVESARYLAAVQQGELFPQVGYEFGAETGKDSFLGGPSPDRGKEDDFLLLANVFWEIDVWGRIRRATESARGVLFATEAVRRGVVLSLVSGVAQAWYELLDLERELAIARESVVTFQTTLDLFERQYRGGVASKLDSLRAEAALAQAAARVPEFERLIVAKENELSILVGRPAGSIRHETALAAQVVTPEVPAGVPSQLLERRPDLIEAEQRLISSNARIGQALANYFPRIGLTAVAGSVSTELSALLESSTGWWSLAGSAVGPLFSFGRTTYTYKAAQAATDASRAEYESAVLNSLREVSDALTAREKLIAVRAAREREVAALRESVKISLSRYLGGLSTYIEVLDALQQLYPAEFALAQTERDQLLAVVALYRTLGGGWNADVPQPKVPQPIAP
jgi:multidrug efflux system outer membrane protein